MHKIYKQSQNNKASVSRVPKSPCKNFNPQEKIALLAYGKPKHVVRSIFFLGLSSLLLFCSPEKEKCDTPTPNRVSGQSNKYAKGFSISKHETHKILTVFSSLDSLLPAHSYVLYPKGKPKPAYQPIAAESVNFVETPIASVVVTSTTDIPVLEYLGKEKTLKGFPNLDYISSEKTRKLIDSGAVQELGVEGMLNQERTLALRPDLIITNKIPGTNRGFHFFKKNNITVLVNNSWLEAHPLGRAEWIKCIAAFYDKDKAADSIFNSISKAYTRTRSQLNKVLKPVNRIPKVMSGIMYKDIWYVPGGKSYVAQFFKDAKTDYLWADFAKMASIPLRFESVYERAHQADLWIGAGSHRNYESLIKSSRQYQFFCPFRDKNVYATTRKIGVTGGYLYFELGALRPDLILKDIIKIAHPQQLPDHELYFYERLNDN